MAGWLSLNIDESQLQRAALDFDATPAQLRKAWRSALTKMARWIRTRSARGLSSELELPQNIIRARIKSTMDQKGGSLRVWYGLDPVGLSSLKPRQTSEGVTAGKHKRPGAFLANSRSGTRQVFKREGKQRLPIKRQTVDINDRAVTYIEDDLLGADEFDRQFWKFFEHELAWRTQTQK